MTNIETIAVTGATGFIGPYVIDYLKALGKYRVIAVGRSIERLKALETDYVVYDIGHCDPECFKRLRHPDHLIHLAWDGLPDYDGLLHIADNLSNSCQFLTDMVSSGLKGLSVAGTCLEYGLKNGCLDENLPPNPTTCYGTAKDTLRRYVEKLTDKYHIRHHWLRLFYLFGKGQSPQSLMSQLDQAIMSRDASFDMSGGEQLRDFLPVEEAAQIMVKASLQDRYPGTLNICSGKPVSIRRLVEEKLASVGSKMRLNLGKYPYPAYEPMAFWGEPTKMKKAVHAFEQLQRQTSIHRRGTLAQ